MANDAFALSPISASSALPSEADYHAISEAFMETSRGRWFLKEYARRNRNADTAMVLEAVERIEGVLAAQKQPAPATIPIAETIATVRAIVEAARGTAAEALAGLNAEEARAPTRKGLRIILEIAWRLREIGYDNRICDILEAQANTIGANQDALATLQTNDAVLGAFDAILRQLGDLTDVPPPSATPATPDAHAVAENVVSLKPAAPVARATPAEVAPAVTPPASAPAAAVEIAPAPAAETPVAPAATAAPAASSIEDEIAALTAMAVAERVVEPTPAAEPMPAAEAVLPAAADPVVAAVMPAAATLPPEPVAAIPQPMQQAASAEPAAAPAASPSLGDALLARGMVTSSKPQPLAGILRMSQAEKVAFFS
ncbi:MAG: hypothetical protein AB1586_23880 [Pseudomonadota bacterium]|jgi:hypothetical protein